MHISTNVLKYFASMVSIYCCSNFEHVRKRKYRMQIAVWTVRLFPARVRLEVVRYNMHFTDSSSKDFADARVCDPWTYL